MLMTPDDLNAYDKRIFEEVTKLIHGRDPSLDESAIKREALNILAEHVRAVSVSDLLGADQPTQMPAELEQLHKHAEGMADALEKLSRQSDIELRYISGSKRLPDLKRLQLDAADLSEALREGLKKKPPARRGRQRDFAQENLLEEATTVFEQAYGVTLNDLPKPPTQKSRNIKHRYHQFVRIYMPEPHRYESQEQFDTLKKYSNRYLESQDKK